MPADAACQHRLVKRSRTADLDHAIDPAAAGDLQRLGSPGLHFLVIDQIVRAQRLHPLELLVRGRGGNHRGAGRLGELQREDGHAARALDQHRVPGLERVIHEQGAPRGQSGAGQRGRFGMAEALGRAGEPMRRRGDRFARIAIDAVTRYAGEGTGGRRAVEPVGKEGADDVVAHGEFGHAFAHRSDHARAIGHRDAALRGGDHALDHRIVVIVERACLQPDRNLAGTGRGGIVDVAIFQRVERGGRRARTDRFHSAASSSSTRCGPRISPPGAAPVHSPSRKVTLPFLIVAT